MPRVRLVYQEHGEWAPAVAQIGQCKHPRERLRFDGNFAVPCYVYCRDCGTRYIDPWMHVSDEERTEIKAEAQKRAAEICDALGIES